MEKTRKNEYHHKNLKNELIENAIKIISEDGISNLSLRNLSSKCGVSHNAVYRHFPSKENMIDACRKYISDGLTVYLEESIENMDTKNPETIYHLSYAYINYFKENPAYFNFIYDSKTYCKIVFSLDEVEENYPPYEIFRKVCLSLISEFKLSREEGLRRLVRYWSLMHGVVSLMISPNVSLLGDWDFCLKDMFLIGGKKEI